MSDHEKIQEAVDLLKQVTKEKRVELLEILKSAYAEAKHAQEKVTDKVKDVTSSVDKSVRKNPWAFIGGAALAGVLIGFLIRRSRR